jgi:hypothetical protein
MSEMSEMSAMSDPFWYGAPMSRVLKRPRYLSVSQVARMTFTSTAAVRRWCQRGQVVARLTPGEQWRIRADDEGWPAEPEPEPEEESDDVD